MTVSQTDYARAGAAGGAPPAGKLHALEDLIRWIDKVEPSGESAPVSSGAAPESPDDGGLSIIGDISHQAPWSRKSIGRAARQRVKQCLIDGQERKGCCDAYDVGSKTVTSDVGIEAIEDTEWDERQKQTGAAGRLVTYEDILDLPQEDVMFRDGGNGRIVVARVFLGGKAWRAGVTAGDVLVSINGKKSFSGLPARDVHASLNAPVVLVFMGFVGKLQAEVRLNHKRKALCGLSTSQELNPGTEGTTVEVIDEVVFEPVTLASFPTALPLDEAPDAPDAPGTGPPPCWAD